MNPLVLVELLNYSLPVQALKVSDSSDYSAPGYLPKNICMDYGRWRSQGVQDLDIYSELYASYAINCVILLGTNISPRASVTLSTSNASGVGGFNTPLQQVPLKYVQGGKWIYLGEQALEAAKYYRVSISDPDPQEDYFEIEKLFIGQTETMALPIVDGWTDGNENHQKREITNGQWNPGTTNSLLKTLELPFRSAAGLIPAEKTKVDWMIDFVERVKTSRPFLFILDAEKPELYCEYMTLADEEVNIEVDEADRTTFNLSLKETK